MGGERGDHFARKVFVHGKITPVAYICIVRNLELDFADFVVL